jgi:hypothetical protein
MFDISLLAGRSRGFTLMMRSAEADATRGGRGSGDEAAATRGDLIAALRFPLAPGWILRAPRRPVGEAMPPPRGCG